MGPVLTFFNLRLISVVPHIRSLKDRLMLASLDMSFSNLIILILPHIGIPLFFKPATFLNFLFFFFKSLLNFNWRKIRFHLHMRILNFRFHL